MNPSIGNTRARRRGIMIIECIGYIAICFVLMGIAYEALYRGWDSSWAFRRNADDVTRSLHAGERWRADVRGAAGPIARTQAGGTETLRIPQAGGDVVYTVAGGEARRRVGVGSEVLVLSNIKTSQMEGESRPFGQVWRWELELKSNRQHVALRPLFTFAAVSAEGGSHEH